MHGSLEKDHRDAKDRACNYQGPRLFNTEPRFQDPWTDNGNRNQDQAGNEWIIRELRTALIDLTSQPFNLVVGAAATSSQVPVNWFAKPHGMLPNDKSSATGLNDNIVRRANPTSDQK